MNVRTLTRFFGDRFSGPTVSLLITFLGGRGKGDVCLVNIEDCCTHCGLASIGSDEDVWQMKRM